MADHKERWQELYEAAVLETNLGKMQSRIQAAKAAIDARLHELQMDHGGTPEERHALSDALAGLRILGREIEARPSRDTKQDDLTSDRLSD
jgi:hypothetical protein